MRPRKSLRNAIYRLLDKHPRLWSLFRVLPTANSRIRVLKKLPRSGRGAEIGVWKGVFSWRIYHLVAPAKLYLVDPWAFNPNYPARMYGGQSARSQDDMDAIYRDVCSRFDPLPEVEITRAPSSTFFQRLGDEKLDFVYIDGDHSFEFVLQDLRLARASLKPGGIIVGDDYRWRDSDGTRSVEMAVQAFASQHGLKVELIGNQVLIRV